MYAYGECSRHPYRVAAAARWQISERRAAQADWVLQDACDRMARDDREAGHDGSACADSSAAPDCGGAGRSARGEPVPSRALDPVAQAGWRVLAHRPGVFGARVARAVGGAKTFSCAADRYRRAAADQGGDPVARSL